MSGLPDFKSLNPEDRKVLESHLLKLRSSIVQDKETIDSQSAQIKRLEKDLQTAVSGLQTIRTQILVESAARSDRSFREEVTKKLLLIRAEFLKIQEAKLKKASSASSAIEPQPSDSPLANQSQYMAAARELESCRDAESRLFNDPFAHQFAGDWGRKFISQFAEDLKVTPDYLSTFVAFLTRYVDDALVKALNANPELKQVVILGAQGDSRAFRVEGIPSGITFYHVDRESVLRYRRSVLSSAKAKHSCVDVSADPFSDSWATALIASSFDKSKPALFILEGKLAYLAQKQIDAQLTLLQSVASKGSVVIGDMPNQKNVSLEALHVIWDKYADPVKTGCDEPEELFGNYGFDATNVEILGAGVTNYGDRAPPHFVEHMATAPRGAVDKIPRILTFTFTHA